METAKTMEQIILDAARKGWRISCLSEAVRGRYSCVLERKAGRGDGYPVFALGDALCASPLDALASAWRVATTPLETANRALIDAIRPEPLPPSMDSVIMAEPGYRMKLEASMAGLLAAITGDAPEPEDEWEI